jgi:hypothetical protein
MILALFISNIDYWLYIASQKKKRGLSSRVLKKNKKINFVL